MISPLERAKLLDAEMRLQRAWLELSLRELSGASRGSPWATTLKQFQLGKMGLSFLKHRSLWLAAISLLANFYRRHTHKEK
jgi:hypothetical protein